MKNKLLLCLIFTSLLIAEDPNPLILDPTMIAISSGDFKINENGESKLSEKVNILYESVVINSYSMDLEMSFVEELQKNILKKSSMSSSKDKNDFVICDSSKSQLPKVGFKAKMSFKDMVTTRQKDKNIFFNTTANNILPMTGSIREKENTWLPFSISKSKTLSSILECEIQNNSMLSPLLKSISINSYENEETTLVISSPIKENIKTVISENININFDNYGNMNEITTYGKSTIIDKTQLDNTVISAVKKIHFPIAINENNKTIVIEKDASITKNESEISGSKIDCLFSAAKTGSPSMENLKKATIYSEQNKLASIDTTKSKLSIKTFLQAKLISLEKKEGLLVIELIDALPFTIKIKQKEKWNEIKGDADKIKIVCSKDKTNSYILNKIEVNTIPPKQSSFTLVGQNNLSIQSQSLKFQFDDKGEIIGWKAGKDSSVLKTPSNKK